MSAQTIVGIPGLDVDLAGASARMRAGDDAIHEPTAVLKTAVSRTCDAVAAPLRRAAEAAIAAGSPAAADLPFCRGLVAERDGSWHAVAVVTSPDLARSATAVAALAALAAARPRREDGDDDYAGAIVDGIKLEERYREQGWPEDLAPSPDDRIVEVVAVAGGSDREVRAELAKVARGSWSPALSFRARPTHTPWEDEPWHANDPSLHEPCSWLDAMEAVRPLLAGEADAIAVASREVGSRRHHTFLWTDDDAGAAAIEVGQAIALMDGGLPGAQARAALTAVFADVAARLLEAQSRHVPRICRMLAASPGATFEMNRGTLRLEARAGDDLLWIEDENGSLLLQRTLDGARRTTGYRLARHGDGGLPAPGCLAALDAGSVAFPGFGGGFGTTAGGRLEAVAAPPFATRRLRDATLAEAVLAEAECTIGGEAEDEAPCPAGHAGPDGVDAAGIALDSRGVSP